MSKFQMTINQKQASPTLSVLIMNFNTKLLTLECLRSVYAETRETTFELILADNSSPDGSVQAISKNFPNVKLIALDKNQRFGSANNLAAKQAARQIGASAQF
jgi:N-acetylglucosaminyl-diphospho-decaprenol L-rhamnosyltransferase